MQAFWLVSAVHGVSVPVHGVAVADHEQPGVVQLGWSGALHVGVPVHELLLNEQPSAWQSLELVSCEHGVRVPVHVASHEHPEMFWHIVCDV